jgi:hypothetical protein
MTADVTLLRAALVGYQAQLSRVNGAIEEIRAALAGSESTSRPAIRASKSRISTDGRKRIAKAQKRRWEAYRKQKKH